MGLDPSVLFNRTLDLITKEGEYVSAWSERLVTINAGIGAAIGAVVSWRAIGHGLEPAVAAVVVVLSLLALSLTWLVVGLILRHHAWQAAYVESAKLIEGPDGVVFRENMIHKKAGLSVTTFFTVARNVLCCGWAVVAITAVVVAASR